MNNSKKFLFLVLMACATPTPMQTSIHAVETLVYRRKTIIKTKKIRDIEKEVEKQKSQKRKNNVKMELFREYDRVFNKQEEFKKQNPNISPEEILKKIDEEDKKAKRNKRLKIAGGVVAGAVVIGATVATAGAALGAFGAVGAAGTAAAGAAGAAGTAATAAAGAAGAAGTAATAAAGAGTVAAAGGGITATTATTAVGAVGAAGSVLKPVANTVGKVGKSVAGTVKTGLGKLKGVFAKGASKAGGAATQVQNTAAKATDLAGGGAVQSPMAQKFGAALLQKTDGLKTAVDAAKNVTGNPQAGPGIFEKAQSALGMVSTAAFAAPAISSMIPKKSSGGESVAEAVQEAAT